ncbi:MAG: hypothetical protein L0338_15935, partial [Acidobacteria bacterium]|nr:hypothetical protein [Acidobacteriota bacterium]
MQLTFSKYYQGRYGIEQLADYLNVKVKRILWLEQFVLKRATAYVFDASSFIVLGHLSPTIPFLLDAFPDIYSERRDPVCARGLEPACAARCP